MHDAADGGGARDDATPLASALDALDRQLVATLAALQVMGRALCTDGTPQAAAGGRGAPDRASAEAVGRPIVVVPTGPAAPTAVPPSPRPVGEVLGELDRLAPPRTPRPSAAGRTPTPGDGPVGSTPSLDAPAEVGGAPAGPTVPEIAPPSLIRPVAEVLPRPE